MIARWMGINPVWYVDLSRAPGEWRDWPIKEALNTLVRDAANQFEDHPISRLAPFFEGMGSWPNGNGGTRLREFSWEREWRHVADLNLAPWWSKMIWLCPEGELDTFSALIGGVDPEPGLSAERPAHIGICRPAAALTPSYDGIPGAPSFRGLKPCRNNYS